MKSHDISRISPSFYSRLFKHNMICFKKSPNTSWTPLFLETSLSARWWVTRPHETTRETPWDFRVHGTWRRFPMIKPRMHINTANKTCMESMAGGVYKKDQVIQFVTFLSPGWRSLNHLKGSLKHPKKVTSRIARDGISLQYHRDSSNQKNEKKHVQTHVIHHGWSVMIQKKTESSSGWKIHPTGN